MTASKNQIFCGYSDGELRVFDALTGLCLATLQPDQSQPIWTIIALDSPNQLAVGSASGKLFIIDSEEVFDLTQTLSLFQGEVLAACWSRNSQILFVSGSDSNIFAVKKNQVTGRYEVLGKVRGQSHAVFSLACIETVEKEESNLQNQESNIHSNKNQIWKIVSGGENSDICVIDFGLDGFAQKLNEKGRRGFRHVLENSSSSLQSCYSPDSFIRKGTSFTEILQIDRSKSDIEIVNKFSLEHASPISTLDFCQKSNSLAAYFPENQEVSVYNTLTGGKNTLFKNKSIGWLKFMAKSLLYFDVEENCLCLLDKHKITDQDFKETDTVRIPWDKFMPDDLQVDIRERYLLVWDKLLQKVAVFNTQNKHWTDLSSIYTGKNSICSVLLHPVQAKVFYLDSRNRLFTFCLKTKSTFKIDLSKREIPKNIQVYKILGSLHKSGALMLVSDYQVVYVNISEKESTSVKKNHKILSIVPVIDRTSDIFKYFLLLYSFK